MKNLDDYTIPYMLRIGRNPDTEQLYTLEDRATEAISAAAREFGKVTSTPESQYWTQAIPFELFTMLESFDQAASVAAALAYVEYYRHRQPDLVKHFEDRITSRSIPVPEGE